MKKQTRSEAREAAFTQIFQINQHGDELEEMISSLLADKPECESNLGYIRKVVYGVCEKRDELIEDIKKYLRPGWSIERISKVSLTILKLAVYEIKYMDDVPEKVAINEAVNLAKRYGADKDASFVNGVLGSFVRGRDNSENK
jgi:N utilization substance protein B